MLDILETEGLVKKIPLAQPRAGMPKYHYVITPKGLKDQENSRNNLNAVLNSKKKTTIKESKTVKTSKTINRAGLKGELLTEVSYILQDFIRDRETCMRAIQETVKGVLSLI